MPPFEMARPSRIWSQDVACVDEARQEVTSKDLLNRMPEGNKVVLFRGCLAFLFCSHHALPTGSWFGAHSEKS